MWNFTPRRVLVPGKQGLMFILTEKLELPRRIQVFNDHVAEDAAQQKREDDDRWLNRILDVLTGSIRRIRK